MTERGGGVERKSRETQISCEVRLDAGRQIQVATGLPFLDHMLEQTARYGAFDLRLEGAGDLQVDPHHLMEDAGIVLGQALGQALGDRAGIVRFATA
jgi:imidazoleglycerol-phosphate dehydratase